MRADRGAFIIINCTEKEVGPLRKWIIDSPEGANTAHLVVKESWRNSGRWHRDKLGSLWDSLVEAFHRTPVQVEPLPAYVGQTYRTKHRIEEVAGSWRIIKDMTYGSVTQPIRTSWVVENTDVECQEAMTGFASLDQARQAMVARILAQNGVEHLTHPLYTSGSGE